jgi:probable F420-dependent oxidoreductase
MQIGAVFPQTEIGDDPGAIRAYAEAVSAAGYRHLSIYDHVLGADRRVHANWSGPYNISDSFHEPLTLFAWLAGFSPLEFATSILIGPQRQTVLLAKQTAEVDRLSGGRLRLGLGIGWNHVEYEALGQDFNNRAARLEEQIILLRRLWSEVSVTFEGKFHTVTGAGLKPSPIQRPIPIWLGAMAPPALRRVGQMADGWFPQALPGDGLEEALAVIADAAIGAGRDPATIGMEGQVRWATGDLKTIARHAEKWREAGATHLSVNTLDAGCTSVDDHIAALTAVADALIESPVDEVSHIADDA